MTKTSYGLAALLLSAFLAAAVCTPVSAQVADGEEPMPTELWWPGYPEYPIFVAAANVTDAAGVVDDALFAADAVSSIQKTLSLPYSTVGESSCVDSSNVYSDDREPQREASLQHALSARDNVFVGSVVGLAPGFSSSRPGTLVRIATEEVLRGFARELNYVFYPEGTFSVGHVRICAGNSTYASLPSNGDRVLVIFDDSRYNDQSILLSTAPSGLVTLRTDGGFGLPPLFRRNGLGFSARTSSELVDRSREQARRGERAR